MSYTESDEYQEEIAEQYKKRVFLVSKKEVVALLHTLGISDFTPDEITETAVGNMNGTFVLKNYVIKVTKNREPLYAANKIAFDALDETARIPHVVAYDFYDKTFYEVLVMKRTLGALLLDTILDMSAAEQSELFRQVLQTGKLLFSIRGKGFGYVNTPDQSFATYADFLRYRFDRSVKKIREKNLAAPEDISVIEKYVLERMDILKEGDPVFCHTDIHMGNILHQGQNLTGLIDLDTSEYALPIATFPSLLGFIHQPSQYVEGTKEYPRFKHKRFPHLLPVLKEEWKEILEDPLLLKKLNLLCLIIGIGWVAGDWSSEWNKEMMERMLAEELITDGDFSGTYFGKALLDPTP